MKKGGSPEELINGFFLQTFSTQTGSSSDTRP